MWLNYLVIPYLRFFCLKQVEEVLVRNVICFFGVEDHHKLLELSIGDLDLETLQDLLQILTCDFPTAFLKIYFCSSLLIARWNTSFTQYHFPIYKIAVDTGVILNLCCESALKLFFFKNSGTQWLMFVFVCLFFSHNFTDYKNNANTK